MDEHVALLATIFSDDNQVKMVENLSEHDAQAFIDIIDKVCPTFFHPQRVSFRSNLHTLSARHWITSPHRPVGSICAFYTIFAAAMPCFHSHWRLPLVTTQRAMRCVMVDLEKCGRVDIKAGTLRSRF